MGDVDVPAAESIDPPAARVSPDFPWWDRSQSRTPMPWTAGPGAGFTTADRPWLRFGADTAERNVAAQAADADSVLAAYRRIIAARRSVRSLQDGDLAVLRGLPEDVLGYRRTNRPSARDEALVLVAFSPAAAEVRLPATRGGGGWRTLVGSSAEPSTPSADGRRLRLRPLEGVVLVPSR